MRHIRHSDIKRHSSVGLQVIDRVVLFLVDLVQCINRALHRRERRTQIGRSVCCSRNDLPGGYCPVHNRSRTRDATASIACSVTSMGAKCVEMSPSVTESKSGQSGIRANQWRT